ncbi:MAG: NAD(P)-dependent oxidoreductase [Candidatus Latescibacterota bacterium]|nr:NAD(P)-dependent oxidoreductase [Candidatus Latescibacterota bacterium]
MLKILLTGAGTPLGLAVARELRSKGHTLRLSDQEQLRTDGEFVKSQLSHGKTTDRLVKGMHTIVHIPVPASDEASAWIDAGTRTIYNLLTAASIADIKHVVYVSTLDLMVAYDSNIRVDENFRPRPNGEPHQLAAYLGEFVAEEFAQTRQLGLTVLRLGHLTEDDTPGDDMSLHLHDAACAVARAVNTNNNFRLYHVQGDYPGARFSIHAAQHGLDWQPKQLKKEGA